MSNISQKLTYLNETKSQLKDMINYGLPTENQITNETTFRNYVKGIFEAFIESLRDSTTLYTNLPKISGNGTQITLNDTANAPMRITLKASELSQDATPTPDTPQDIHTISGDNSVVVEGKNLCNGINQNVYLNTAVNTCGIASNNSGLYIKVDGGNYTISTTASQTRYRVACSNVIPPSVGSATAYNGQNKDGTSNSITIDTTGYKYLIVNATDLTKIQIEKGSTATTYEPYVSQTAPINLDTIEYCKIGNYEDEFIYNTTDTNLELNKWYLKKNIGKVVLDGSENWTWQSGGVRTYITINDSISTNYNNASFYCTHFTPKTSNFESGNVVQYGKIYYFYISNLVSNLNDFKTWLSNNNVTLIYVLGTPTYTQITGTLETQLNNIYEKLLSYKGTTNISQVNNDLPFVLGVSAIQDLE